jgi:hypothetical protein
MNFKKLLQVLTLTLFLLLLTSAIAYKTGKLDKYLTQGDNSKEQQLASQSLPVDSPKVKKPDTVLQNPAMMSTSKSMIMIDQKVKFEVDTTKKKSKK